MAGGGARCASDEYKIKTSAKSLFFKKTCIGKIDGGLIGTVMETSSSAAYMMMQEVRRQRLNDVTADRAGAAYPRKRRSVEPKLARWIDEVRRLRERATEKVNG